MSEQHNTDLSDIVLDWRKRAKGTRLTNRGGWQSPMTLLDIAAPAVTALEQSMRTAIRLMMDGLGATDTTDIWSLAAWANVNPQRAFNAMHAHVGAVWSGVYYVSLPRLDEPADNGAISFENPSAATVLSACNVGGLSMERLFSANYVVKPRKGQSSKAPQGTNAPVSQLVTPYGLPSLFKGATNYYRIRRTPQRRSDLAT